jgi:hypothetical protein
MTEADPDASRHDSDDHFGSPREERELWRHPPVTRASAALVFTRWGRQDEEAEMNQVLIDVRSG